MHFAIKDQVFQPKIGIPMGSDLPSFLANFFMLLCYAKYPWVVPLKDKRGITIAKITKKILFKASL